MYILFIILYGDDIITVFSLIHAARLYNNIGVRQTEKVKVKTAWDTHIFIRISEVWLRIITFIKVTSCTNFLELLLFLHH